MKTLVIALQKDSKIVSATYEVIEAAKGLGGEVCTAVLAADAEISARELAKRGAGKILAVSNPALKHFNDEIFTRVILELISRHSPDLVLGPASFYGRSLFSRLAAVKGGALISDVTGLSLDGDRVILTRPSYGGSVIEQVAGGSADGPLFATVRPKIFPESKDGPGEVVVEAVDDSCFQSGADVVDVKIESAGSQNLAEADIIVSAGRGVRGPDNVAVVKELADSLGAALGASRAVVDAGWLPYSHQVGQTGKTVNPKLYFAVGISGAIQHLVGMRTSHTIVAINRDKDAPIFNIATYGIVGDLFEIVPPLAKKFKEELQR